MRVKMMSKTSDYEFTYEKTSNVEIKDNRINFTHAGSHSRGIGDAFESFNLDVWKFEIIHEVVIRDKEAGNIISGFETVEEAEEEINRYIEQDKQEGTFEEGFYELAVLDGDEYITYIENPIRRQRLIRGLTQSQLARASQSSVRTIQDWESGRRNPRDVYVLRRVAKILECSIEDLLVD